MNVYDFDKTIFYPDSSYCFVWYGMKKYPQHAAKILPAVVKYASLKALKKCSTKELKQSLFSFLKYVEDPDALVAEFWEKYIGNVQSWYLEQKKADDIIISASPEFLLRPVSDRLGFHLIGTIMDKNTGIIRGNNCHDVEKPVRFREQFPDAVIDCFYSDSLSDSPMADISERAVLVDHEKLSPWPGK